MTNKQDAREAAAGERDADAQLTAARAAAYAWLRATLAALPAAVTSLSVGCALEDGDDRPNLAPRLRASIFDGEWNYPVDQHEGADGSPLGDAMQALYLIADDLRTHTRPFLFALGDDEWLTVTRAELAPAVFPVDALVRFDTAPAPIRYAIPVPCPSAEEADTYRTILALLHDLQTGETFDLRVGRVDGVLRWEVRR